MIDEKPRILIIEDDLMWSLQIEMMITDSNYELVGTANSINKARAMIDGLSPDLLICDIRIQDSLSFILFEEGDNDIPTIFMTTHIDEYFYQQAQIVPKSTFLVKSFHQYTLLSTIELMFEKYPVGHSKFNKSITVRGQQQQIKKINLNDIVWIQTEGNYSCIYTVNNKKHVKKRSLTKLIEELDERFVKVHKGFAINKEFVDRVDLRQKIIVVNKTVLIPLGRGFREVLGSIIDEKY